MNKPLPKRGSAYRKRNKTINGSTYGWRNGKKGIYWDEQDTSTSLSYGFITMRAAVFGPGEECIEELQIEECPHNWIVA